MDDEQDLLRQIQDLDYQIEKELQSQSVPSTPADPADEEQDTIAATDVEIAESMAKKAVQPEPSGVQPPVPTPVRADAAIPQVEQQSGDDTSGDSPMTGGAPVPQVDAKVPEAPLQTSNAASQPECKGAPAEGETADAAKEVSRKVKLRNAAKAKIIRWVKPKSKRMDRNAPEMLKNEWLKGNRNAIADLLCKNNFQEESFLNELRILVSKKQLVELTVSEGWYSESEMKDELHWHKDKIEGAKSRCKALGEGYYRHNMYDGNEEFWVIVKESGKRQESHSYEEIQQKRAKATEEPKFELGDKFKSLEASSTRQLAEKEKAAALGPNAESKFGQTKDKFKKFLDSMMSKTGKLRALVKDLKTKYADDDGAKKSVEQLKKEIANLDSQFDSCQDVWAKGEAEGFFTESFYSAAEDKMKHATLACSKAVAVELKTRSQKKFFDKSIEDGEPAKPKKEKKEKKDRKDKPESVVKKPKSKKEKKAADN